MVPAAAMEDRSPVPADLRYHGGLHRQPDTLHEQLLSGSAQEQVDLYHVAHPTVDLLIFDEWIPADMPCDLGLYAGQRADREPVAHIPRAENTGWVPGRGRTAGVDVERAFPASPAGGLAGFLPAQGDLQLRRGSVRTA